jgi:hypothetical protein
MLVFCIAFFKIFYKSIPFLKVPQCGYDVNRGKNSEESYYFEAINDTCDLEEEDYIEFLK